MLCIESKRKHFEKQVFLQVRQDQAEQEIVDFMTAHINLCYNPKVPHLWWAYSS